MKRDFIQLHCTHDDKPGVFAQYSLMIFGPFPLHFVGVLREKLQTQGRHLRVLSSPEEIEKFRQSTAAREATNLPTYGTSPDLIYVDIEQTDLLIVKSDLEKMGASVVDRKFDPEFARGEYLCPKCDHVSESPGLCPKHKTRLLDFSEYAADKRLRREKGEKIFGIVALILALSIAVLVYFGT